jgi:hypothetical protein
MSINISCKEIIYLIFFSRIKYDSLNHACHERLNIKYIVIVYFNPIVLFYFYETLIILCIFFYVFLLFIKLLIIFKYPQIL